MKQTRRAHLAMLGGTATAALVPASLATADETTAEPQVHLVEMLNVDPDDKKKRQIFKPTVLRAMPGDTVRFVATDRGHNSQVDENMMPEGGDMWEGKINEEIEITVTADGTYGYYCKPHRSVGMVGLILWTSQFSQDPSNF